MSIFPIIRSINQILPHLGPEFSVIQKDGFKVIQYNYSYGIETFGGTLKDNFVKSSILRECRGIVFYDNGLIARRGFHKFFNLNENIESSFENLNWNDEYDVIIKLDGSQIIPFILNNKIIWGTKRVDNEFHGLVSDFVKDKSDYEKFVRRLYQLGLCPIFEYISKKKRIVVDYPKDNLFLLAVRDLYCGNYLEKYQIKQLLQGYKIPFVEYLDLNLSPIQLIEKTKNLIGEEGYVIRFKYDQYTIKLKSLDYLKIHKAKEFFNYEKDIINLILTEKSDDLKPVLNADDLKKLNEFEFFVNQSIDFYSYNIFNIVKNSKTRNMNKKDFALFLNSNDVVPQNHKIMMSILYNSFEKWEIMTSQELRIEIRKLIVELILKNTGSNSNLEKVKIFWHNKEW